MKAIILVLVVLLFVSVISGNKRRVSYVSENTFKRPRIDQSPPPTPKTPPSNKGNHVLSPKLPTANSKTTITYTQNNNNGPSKLQLFEENIARFMGRNDADNFRAIFGFTKTENSLARDKGFLTFLRSIFTRNQYYIKDGLKNLDPSQYNNIALRFAAFLDRPYIVKALIQNPKVVEKSLDGIPLAIATAMGHVKTAEMLAIATSNRKSSPKKEATNNIIVKMDTNGIKSPLPAAPQVNVIKPETTNFVNPIGHNHNHHTSNPFSSSKQQPETLSKNNIGFKSPMATSPNPNIFDPLKSPFSSSPKDYHKLLQSLKPLKPAENSLPQNLNPSFLKPKSDDSLPFNFDDYLIAV